MGPSCPGSLPKCGSCQSTAYLSVKRCQNTPVCLFCMCQIPALPSTAPPNLCSPRSRHRSCASLFIFLLSRCFTPCQKPEHTENISKEATILLYKVENICHYLYRTHRHASTTRHPNLAFVFHHESTV